VQGQHGPRYHKTVRLGLLCQKKFLIRIRLLANPAGRPRFLDLSAWGEISPVSAASFLATDQIVQGQRQPLVYSVQRASRKGGIPAQRYAEFIIVQM
jgi:hypothetical protein